MFIRIGKLKFSNLAKSAELQCLGRTKTLLY